MRIKIIRKGLGKRTCRRAAFAGKWQYRQLNNIKNEWKGKI